MKNIFLVIVSIFIVCQASHGQAGENGHFLVTFEKFTPPVQDLVRSFEGHPAEPFMANDVNGVEHFLGNYKGKKVILWFWSTENMQAIDQISPMTLLQERNPKLKIISFAKEPKAAVLEYLRNYPMDITVIPNGEVFGQMAYGAGMGNPRMFVIDEYGIIKAALPQQAFSDSEKLLISLESIINGF